MITESPFPMKLVWNQAEIDNAAKAAPAAASPAKGPGDEIDNTKGCQALADVLPGSTLGGNEIQYYQHSKVSARIGS